MNLWKISKHSDKEQPRISNTIPVMNGALLSNDNQFFDKEAEINNLLKNVITQQYNNAIDTVTTFVEQMEGKELEGLKLTFSHMNDDYLARAIYKSNEIEVNIDALLKPKLYQTFIHEISHHIVNRYINKRLGHCLEFAIICYCLQYKHDYRTDFFLRSYDIKEDKSFRFLVIDVCEFDNFIKNISWSSIQELAEKATTLANEIRKKSVPNNLF